MTTLDELFHAPVDPLVHPRLRNWKQRLSQPEARAQVELYRPASGLGLAQTDVNLHFTQNGAVQPIETFAWDDELNAGLITLGVRAVDLDQEAERFALGLRGALRKAEREFGDGYLNSVLVEFINDSELTQVPQIADILRHAHAIRPHRGNGYLLCREMIKDALAGRARELTDHLKYNEQQAKQVLTQALTRYLDERFSVSSRRQLGLL